MSMPSSIWYRDANPQPLDHESTPITTRPGLPPECILYYVPSRNEETVTVWLHCFALLHIRRQVWRGAYHRDLFLAIGLLDLYCDHHHLLKTCHNWRKNFSSTAWWWRRLRDFADSQFAGSSRAIFYQKIGPTPASFCSFSSFSHYNFNNTNWKKLRWCVWDSNPRQTKQRSYGAARVTTNFYARVRFCESKMEWNVFF